jgi:hypothetical protein
MRLLGWIIFPVLAAVLLGVIGGELFGGSYTDHGQNILIGWLLLWLYEMDKRKCCGCSEQSP